MTNVKAGFILLATFVASVLFAIPVGRFYGQFYQYQYGIEAVPAGFLLSLYFLSGLFFGIYYKAWYKNKVSLLESIVLFLLFLWFVQDDVTGWFFLALLAAGYILGFVINKLRLVIRNYMMREVQKSQQESQNRKS